MSSQVILKQESYADLIRRLTQRFEPRLRRKFLNVIDQISNDKELRTIAASLGQGKIDEAVRRMERIFASFAHQVNVDFVEAGQAHAQWLSGTLRVVIDFDQTNVRAVNVMRNARLNLIREFTQVQTEATREALTSAIEAGVNPRVQARAFRDSIGLTRRQVMAVNNYKRLLRLNSLEALDRQLRDRRFDSTVRNAIRNDVPLTNSQIERMVSRYRERYIQYRSRVIARTESIRAVHEANQEMLHQSVDSGELDQSRIVRTWVSAKDERVRDSHSSMNGQEVGFDQPFISGNGNFLMYPLDPNAPPEETIQCRCVATTRITRVRRAQ